MKFFSLIETEDVHVAPETKVVPSKEFTKLIKADALLKQTKKEEKDYRKDVAVECEALKEAATRDGFEEGLKQLSEQIERLDREIKSVRKEMENTMVPLALTAVKKIVGKELETHPETIVDIVATALKAVTQHRKVKIFANPGDLENLEEARPRLRALFEHLDSLTIAPREDVEVGGCIIETEAGIINAQLESQLQALESAFEVFFKQNHNKGA